MEGIPLGRGRELKVDRDYECCHLERTLLATAYEEIVPLMRRELPVPGSSCEAREWHGERVAVGA